MRIPGAHHTNRLLGIYWKIRLQNHLQTKQQPETDVPLNAQHPVCAPLGLIYMNWIIVIVAIITLFVLFTHFSNKKWKRKLNAINDSRPALSKEEYLDRLVARGCERNNVSVTYDILSSYLNRPNFSLHPDDDIYGTYEIDPEDFEDLVTEVFQKLKKPLPSKGQVDDINQKYQKDMQVDYVLELLKIETSPNII